MSLIVNSDHFSALIVATGAGFDLHARLAKDCPACLSPLAQLIVTFQTAGVRDISIVATAAMMDHVQKGNQKRGVRFLQAAETGDESEQAGTLTWTLLRAGLNALSEQDKSIFVVSEQRPFFRPGTVVALADTQDAAVMPTYDEVGGSPILLRPQAVRAVLQQAAVASEMDAAAAQHVPENVLTSPSDCSQQLKTSLQAAGINIRSSAVDDDGCILSLQQDLPDQILMQRLSGHALQAVAKTMLAGSAVFFGPGAAQLLRLIRETGSVRDACERMGISYSKAWRILRNIAQQTGKESVERKQGGVTGGSAELTAHGESLLRLYDDFDRRCQAAIRKIYQEVFQDFEHDRGQA